MTEYENLASDGTITDPTVILRWRDRHICDRMDDVNAEIGEKRGRKGWG